MPTQRTSFWIGVVVFCLFSGSLQAEVVQVDNEGLKRLIEEGVPVIDVRTAPEWKETGVIAGSHLLTFFDEQGRYDTAKWTNELRQLVASDQPFAVICAVGPRSDAITRHLSNKLGYKKVYNVTKGIMQWIQANNPTVKPE